MVHGKGIGFFLGREWKSDAYCHACEKYEKVTNVRCDLFHSVMVSKKRHYLRRFLWAIDDRKTISLEVLSWANNG